MAPSYRRLGAKAVEIALAQVGKPYALDFAPPPNQFYCSSLVRYAYQQASGREHVFLHEAFNLIFDPLVYWQDYYTGMGLKLPVNVTGSNPTLLLHRVQFSTLECHV